MNEAQKKRSAGYFADFSKIVFATTVIGPLISMNEMSVKSIMTFVIGFFLRERKAVMKMDNLLAVFIFLGVIATGLLFWANHITKTPPKDHSNKPSHR